jgi:hypothetical protein
MKFDTGGGGFEVLTAVVIFWDITPCSMVKVNRRFGGTYRLHVGLEVLTAVVMKSTIFWDITPCRPVKVNRRFGGTYRLHVGFEVLKAVVIFWNITPCRTVKVNRRFGGTPSYIPGDTTLLETGDFY